jgi:hypothetical protein
MNSTLKSLLGWILVLAAATYVMDWYDAADQLRQESETSERLRQRTESQTRAVDWHATAETARDAQNAWLDRLVPIEATGVFRAVAMERMADLCTSIGVPCQVGAEGEKVISAPNKAGAMNAEVSDGAALPGLTSATVRVALPTTSAKLRDLIAELESGNDLRSIDKFSQRGARIELTVQTYGMFVPQLEKRRQAPPLPTEGKP